MNTMAITERELELVEDIRSIRKDLYRVDLSANPEEFRQTSERLKKAVEALENERQNIRARKMAVDMINTPGVDLKAFKAFGTIAIILSIALTSWLYISGDLLVKTIPTAVLLAGVSLSGAIYYFGYICKARK